MELIAGQKAKVTNNIDDCHCFEIGSIVEFVEIHDENNDWFIFKGIDKNYPKFKIEQSLLEDEFELIKT